ncbi:hypothetical protein C8R45DRAFT_1105247 [Mycena sanguinolenta]|nr:hypothetical protein C8R45DRAFT_1105247 [Mycena sanguinolenta]
MKFIFNILAISCLYIATVWAQSTHIGFPLPAATLKFGKKFTFQLVRPNSIEGSIEVGIAIALLGCPVSQGPVCPSPTSQLGEILYTGPFNPTVEAAVARLHLIGGGPAPVLELNNITPANRVDFGRRPRTAPAHSTSSSTTRARSERLSTNGERRSGTWDEVNLVDHNFVSFLIAWLVESTYRTESRFLSRPATCSITRARDASAGLPRTKGAALFVLDGGTLSASGRDFETRDGDVPCASLLLPTPYSVTCRVRRTSGVVIDVQGFRCHGRRASYGNRTQTAGLRTSSTDSRAAYKASSVWTRASRRDVPESCRGGGRSASLGSPATAYLFTQSARAGVWMRARLRDLEVSRGSSAYRASCAARRRASVFCAPRPVRPLVFLEPSTGIVQELRCVVRTRRTGVGGRLRDLLRLHASRTCAHSLV